MRVSCFSLLFAWLSLSLSFYLSALHSLLQSDSSTFFYPFRAPFSPRHFILPRVNCNLQNEPRPTTFTRLRRGCPRRCLDGSPGWKIQTQHPGPSSDASTAAAPAFFLFFRFWNRWRVIDSSSSTWRSSRRWFRGFCSMKSGLNFNFE